MRLSQQWTNVRSCRVWASLTAFGNYAEKIGARGFGVEL